MNTAHWIDALLTAWATYRTSDRITIKQLTSQPRCNLGLLIKRYRRQPAPDLSRVLAQDQDLMSAVEAAVRSLPDKIREVVIERYCRRPWETIARKARRFGISESALYRRLGRARVAVASRLTC